MKRASAAESKQANLNKRRALVRNLIEQNGWSSVAPVGQYPLATDNKILPDNVIPFPRMGTRSQAS